jgi:hypothetical protein
MADRPTLDLDRPHQEILKEFLWTELAAPNREVSFSFCGGKLLVARQGDPGMYSSTSAVVYKRRRDSSWGPAYYAPVRTGREITVSAHDPEKPVSAATIFSADFFPFATLKGALQAICKLETRRRRKRRDAQHA